MSKIGNNEFGGCECGIQNCYCENKNVNKECDACGIQNCYCGTVEKKQKQNQEQNQEQNQKRNSNGLCKECQFFCCKCSEESPPYEAKKCK